MKGGPLFTSHPVSLGEYNCWIGTIRGSIAFFAGPICFVLLTNGLMFAKTMISIGTVAKKLNDRGGHSTEKHRGRRDFFIYLRMFSVLSFNWIFGFLCWAIPDDTETVWLSRLQQIFVFLFVVFAGVNGILIFGIFTFNKRIYQLYANFFAAKLQKNSSCSIINKK